MKTKAMARAIVEGALAAIALYAVLIIAWLAFH